jgi:predicted N-acetyltransferase YhbS
MNFTDYEHVVRLFREEGGMTSRGADREASTQRYLERNPGLSFVAIDGEQIIGSIMAGHDGRRGYLQQSKHVTTQ